MFRIFILVYVICVFALILGLGFLMQSTVEGFQSSTQPLTPEQLAVIKDVVDDKATEIKSVIDEKVNNINKTIDDKNNALASWAVTVI